MERRWSQKYPTVQVVPTFPWFTAWISAPRGCGMCVTMETQGLIMGGIQGQRRAHFCKQHKETMQEFLSTNAAIEAQSNWQAFQMPYPSLKCTALGDMGVKDSATNLV